MQIHGDTILSNHSIHSIAIIHGHCAFTFTNPYFLARGTFTKYWPFDFKGQVEIII